MDPKIPVVPKNQNWKNLELHLITLVGQICPRKLFGMKFNAEKVLKVLDAMCIFGSVGPLMESN